jgi:hypothetical protein
MESGNTLAPRMFFKNVAWKRQDTIAIYVATCPILEACRQGERQRGSMPRQWWWEQPMMWSNDDATGSEE